MFEIVCVTARKLCTEDFLTRLEQVAAAGVDKLILREKDLPEEEYQSLATSVLELCRRHPVECVVHNFPKTAARLGVQTLHLPLPLLRQLPCEEREEVPVLGASCHSAVDVQEAVNLGCSYVTLGHIFPTNCKPGVPARGLDFLREVCSLSPLPVYAIGGISRENIRQVREAGAAGACVMSGLMICPSPAEYIQTLRKEAARE